MDSLGDALDGLERFLGPAASAALLFTGAALTLATRGAQVRLAVDALRDLRRASAGFFAALGGCLGVGNLVTVGACLLEGGPGIVPWMLLAGGLLGSVVKYYEVSRTARCPAQTPTARLGGPFRLYSSAFAPRWAAVASALFAVSMCIYAADGAIFLTVVGSVDDLTGGTLGPDILRWPCAAVLVLLPMRGDVRVVGKACEVLLKILCCAVVVAGSVALVSRLQDLPGVLDEIRVGFLHPSSRGFSLWSCAWQGIKAGIYSADVGIGYASLMYDEDPPALTIADVWIDIASCSFTALLLLLSGQLQDGPAARGRFASGGELVDAAVLSLFRDSLPQYQVALPLAATKLVLGFCCLLSFMKAGFLASRFFDIAAGRQVGEWGFALFSAASLCLSTVMGMGIAFQVMSICGALMLIVNCVAYLCYELRGDHEHRD